MSVAALAMLDFARIVMNFISYFFRFYNQNQGCYHKPVDVLANREIDTRAWL
jgi:hypothetical protein